MDEFDRIAAAAVDEVRRLAERTADTEQALADVRAGVQLAPVVPLGERVGGGRSRRGPLMVAAASIAVLAVAVAVFVRRDDDDTRLVPADVATLPDPTTTPVSVPGTTGEAVVNPDTTVPTSLAPFPGTTLPDGFTGAFVGSSLRFPSDALPGAFVDSRSVDTFGYGGLRADTVTELTFADGRTLRITLGTRDEARYSNRDDAFDLGERGWQIAEVDNTFGSDVATVAGRSLGDDTWITVEAVRTFDPVAQVWSEAAFTLDDVRRAVAGVQYDASADTRPVSTSPAGPPVVGAPCEDATSITGGTDHDLVLFTCDGVLAVYDGATGARTEVIETFDEWANFDPNDPESLYASYVEAIAVSLDGRTVWFTVGPEPVSGTTFRYEIGSGAEPVPVADGRVGGVGADWVVLTTAMPGMTLVGVESDGVTYRTTVWDTYRMFVGGGAVSPDGRVLAIVANGAIGVVDPITGSIALRGPLDGQAYTQAWIGEDGMLYGLLDDGETLQVALVDDATRLAGGNVAPLSTEPFGPRGAVRADGLQLELFGRLLDGDTVVATGVVAAAVVP